MKILILPAILVFGWMGLTYSDQTQPVTDTPLQIYLSPTGVDSNDGLTPNTPVLTLEAAESIIQVLNPDSDVEIRIKQGTYTAGQTTWNTFLDGHTISFMPVDFQVGMGEADIAGRPVFRPLGAPEWWLYAQLPQGHPGGTTGLRFYYLRVENYQNGLMIHGRYTTNENGLRIPATDGANGNQIRGMYFYHLGSLHTGSPSYGVAALDLVNSSDNYVRANQFLYLENGTPNQSHIHAVYMAHGSSNNIVINNKFRYISADAVRIRNQSNGNEVTGNTFDHTGQHAHLVDWFCDGDCVTPTSPQECASHGTYFHDNVIGVGYLGTAIPHTLLVPDGLTYPGPGTCPGFISGMSRVTGGDA